ncbi:phage/plasmid replication protein, II/X family, partial [Acinetobacter baumannii]
DGEILELLRANLFTITKSGKKSTTKADNAFKFYCLLRQMGWESVKAIYKESTFYDNVKALTSVKNIDRGHLQN